MTTAYFPPMLLAKRNYRLRETARLFALDAHRFSNNYTGRRYLGLKVNEVGS